MSVEVSIIIPCYNAEAHIDRAIASVVSQSFENFEILVIDDASRDGTIARLQGYADKRMRLIQLDENSGSPAAPRNRGLQEAQGDYVAFLDCDDFWHPDKLKNQLSYMKDNGHQFSCTSYIVKELDGTTHQRKARPVANVSDLLRRNSVGCSTVVISRDLISGFAFQDCPHEDFDMWLRILRDKNSVYGLDSYLTTYVKRKDSRSRLSLRNIAGFHAIFRRHGRVGRLGAWVMMLRYLRG